MKSISVIYSKGVLEQYKGYLNMQQLIADEKIHSLIKEIVIMNCDEADIIDRFDMFPNLKEITITNTPIKIIPSTLENQSNLEKMTLIMNDICILSTTFGVGLPKLYWLDLQMNKIHFLPESMAKMGELAFLNVNKNTFRNFPEAITKIPKLKMLMINDNKIKTIPESIKNAKSLAELSIHSNRICKIPAEIGSLAQLKSIDFADNVIKMLPSTIGNLVNLESLNLANNLHLEGLPKEIRGCSRLATLNIENNDIHSLPIELVECRRLSKICYYGNPIEIGPVIERFLEQTRNYDQHAGLYADRQNVHTSSIQHSIKASLMNLLNDPVNYDKDSVINSIVDDDAISGKNKQLLIGYINDDKEVHNTIFCTFYDAFSKVYGRIRAAEGGKQVELYKRLNEELGEGECLCFTGRLSRMVNVLNGFYDDIQVTISTNEQIANVILAIRMKNGLNTDDETTDEVKEKIRAELKERGYEDDIIEVWLNV